MRFSISAPWFAAVLACAFSVWLFAPGFMSWDSAFQWYQARSGEFNALHPPMMTLLWSLIEPWWSGPTSMLLLQQAMIWVGLAGIAVSLRLHWSLAVLLMLVVGFWPPLFLMSAHIWKDIPMMGAFLMAVWLLRLELERPGWHLLLPALLLVVLACASRHNAITGALPFVVWIVWRGLDGRSWFDARPVLSRAGLTLCLSVLLAVLVQWAAQLPEHAPGVKRPQAVWSVVALWDMAAVSLAEDRLVFPEAFLVEGAQVEDLRPHFSDWSNTTVFGSRRITSTLVAEFSDEQIADLRRAWLSLPLEHPQAYFRHRLRLAVLLFGVDQQGLPAHQVLQPGFVGFGDNPPLEQAPNALRQKLVTWGLENVHGPFFMGWAYLLAALLVMVAAIPLLRDPDARPPVILAMTMAASALAYALPLALVSGSAEFRYLAWPMQATLLAPALLWLGRGRKPSTAFGARRPASPA